MSADGRGPAPSSNPERRAFNQRLARVFRAVYELAEEARELDRLLPEVVASLPENDLLDRNLLPSAGWILKEIILMDDRIRSTPDIDRIVN